MKIHWLRGRDRQGYECTGALMNEIWHGFLFVQKHGTSSSPASAFPSIVELARLFCTRAKIGHCVDFFAGNMDRAMESQCRIMESLRRAMERLTRAMESLTWCNGKLVITPHLV
jgi:hypothetical protein